MAVDNIARMMALDAAQQGGAADAYTKAETDELLDCKADLENGKVPASELPSYVDDVLEYASTSSFPATGESGKIYVATDTNKTYRWGGSAYVEISESLALGETASTAYPGNKGKANADAIAAIKDGTNIDSFADVETALAAKLNTADVDDALSSTSTNPVQNKAVQAPIAWLVDAGAKNLLKLRQAPVSANTQISGTINNGVVSLSTSTAIAANSYVTISEHSFYLKAGKKYVISGCPGNGLVRLFIRNNSGYLVSQFGNAVEYTPQEDGDYDIIVYLYSGVNISNFEIRPMICTAEDYAISPEFVPYAPSNRELYEMILALQSGT